MDMRARESLIGFAIAMGIVATFVGAFVGLFVLIAEPHVPDAVPVFTAGDTVQMRLDGRAGMVLWARCRKERCSYKVRFSAAALNTDVSLLGRDGAVVSGAYHDVLVREFELVGPSAAIRGEHP